MQQKDKIKIDRHLFHETSHSPSLVDIVGMDMLDKVVDFCFIANPYYPDKKMIRDLQKQLPIVLKSYPSSNPMIARTYLANVLHVNPEHLIIGNGATELITLIDKNMIDDIAIPVPTFSEYIDKLRKKDSAKLYQLPADNHYQLCLNDFADWIDQQQVSSALIINPGNPTGQLIELEEMKAFLQRMSHLKMIIVDESFIDFAGGHVPSLMNYIEQFQNLIIVRSMSKHCGVPGLRLGYCCTANQQFLQEMLELLPIWNINTLAEYFLSRLHETDAQYHKARMRVIDDVQHLFDELVKIKGFYVYPTGTNFILIRCECGLTAEELQDILLVEHYSYVRDCSNKVGIDEYHIRVASQGRKKDKILIKALKEISKKRLAINH